MSEPTHPLRVANFRRLVAANLLGGCGMWMIRLTADWLVLDLSDSPAAVGTLVALQFFPMLLLGPAAGVLTDRYSKRALVIAAQSAQASLAVVLAVTTLIGGVSVPLLWAAALTMGLISSVDQPARQVLVGETVGDGLLVRAVGVSNAFGQLGSLVGPLIAAAVLAAAHPWVSFGLNAAFAAGVIGMVASIRAGALHQNERVPRAKGQIREGIRYVAGHPGLAGVVVLAGAMGALGMNGPVVLSAFAQDIWHTGASGFALSNTVSSIGAIAALVFLLPRLRTGLRTVVLASAAFALLELLAAFSPTYPVFLAALVAVAAATLTFLTLAASYVQVTAAPAMRGRALAIYSPLLLGGHALGGLFQGWTTELLGVQHSLALTGALALVVTAAVAWWLRARVRRRSLASV